MKRPRVSIIIATFQAECVIEKCLVSILKSEHSNFELLIIDGGSTDNTIPIVKRFSSQIAYFSTGKDNGIYDAMLKGVANSKGDFIFFLGADDELLDDYFLALKHLDSETSIYYGNVLFSPSGKIYDGEFNVFKILKKNICHQAIFYPRAVFNKYTFQPKYKLLADYYLNLQLYADNEFSFNYLPYTICKYNELGSSSKTYDHEFINEKLLFIKNNFNFPLYFYFSIRKFVSKYILRSPYY